MLKMRCDQTDSVSASICISGNWMRTESHSTSTMIGADCSSPSKNSGHSKTFDTGGYRPQAAGQRRCPICSEAVIVEPTDLSSAGYHATVLAPLNGGGSLITVINSQVGHAVYCYRDDVFSVLLGKLFLVGRQDQCGPPDEVNRPSESHCQIAMGEFLYHCPVVSVPSREPHASRPAA